MISTERFTIPGWAISPGAVLIARGPCKVRVTGLVSLFDQGPIVIGGDSSVTPVNDANPGFLLSSTSALELVLHTGDELYATQPHNLSSSDLYVQVLKQDV